MNPLRFIPKFLRSQLIDQWHLFSYRWRSPQKWLPKIVYFSVNSVCNMKCKMCDIGQRKRDAQFAQNLCFSQNIELPFSVFKKVIDEIAFFKPQICIIATEPLLYSEILPVSKYVKEKGLKLSITTNGFLLKLHAESLVKFGLDDLWVSLDGTDGLNDLIRGVQGAFDSAIQGVRLIQRIRREMNSKKTFIYINFTISNLNDHNLFDFANKMIREKVDSIHFSHLNFITEEMAKRHNNQFGQVCMATPGSLGSVHPEEVDLRELHEQIKKIKSLPDKPIIHFTPDLSDPTSFSDYYLRPDLPIGKKRCLVPWTVASIQPNGDMILLTRCFHHVVGNVTKQGFLEIWGGENYQSFRKQLWENKYFPACTRCCGIL